MLTGKLKTPVYMGLLEQEDSAGATCFQSTTLEPNVLLMVSHFSRVQVYGLVPGAL